MAAKIRISKLDAARRQLDTAIELWFRDGDAVSIHALAFASYEILQDINKKRGNVEATMLGLVQRNVKPEHVEDAMRLMRKAMRFFKHADRDPHDVLDEFNPEVSEYLFVLCIGGLTTLGERLSDMQHALVMWDRFHRPNLFLKGANPVEDSFGAVEIANMRQLPKRQFLEAALLGLAQGRVGS